MSGSCSPRRRRAPACNVEHATSSLVRGCMLELGFDLWRSPACSSARASLRSHDESSSGDDDDDDDDDDSSSESSTDDDEATETKFGRGTTTSPDWDVYWTDKYNRLKPVYRGLRSYQRVNHFPSMRYLASKIHLARCFERMRRAIPTELSFVPQSWVLPMDFDAFKKQFSTGPGRRAKGGKVFILKPDRGACGRGIELTRSLNDVSVATQRGTVAQLYVPRPLLAEGRKLDLRLFVLITSVDPLRVFMYNDGIVRISCEKYTDLGSISGSGTATHHAASTAHEPRSEDNEKHGNADSSVRVPSETPAAAPYTLEQAELKPLTSDLPSLGSKLMPVNRMMPSQASPSRCARDADLRNKFAHLTNTAINKKHPNFSDNNTRTLTWLISKLRAQAQAAEARCGNGRYHKKVCERKNELQERAMDSDGDSDSNSDSDSGSQSDSAEESTGFGDDDVVESRQVYEDQCEGTDASSLDFGVADVDALQQRLADACVKTLLVAQPLLAQAYRSTFPMAHAHSHCFELLGIDVLLDSKLKPWLLEVNDRPSYVAYTSADAAVKKPMVRDLFRILDVKPAGKGSISAMNAPPEQGVSIAPLRARATAAARESRDTRWIGVGSPSLDAERDAIEQRIGEELAAARRRARQEMQRELRAQRDAIDIQELRAAAEGGFERVYPPNPDSATPSVVASYENVAEEAVHQVKWGSTCRGRKIYEQRLRSHDSTTTQDSRKPSPSGAKCSPLRRSSVSRQSSGCRTDDRARKGAVQRAVHAAARWAARRYRNTDPHSWASKQRQSPSPPRRRARSASRERSHHPQLSAPDAVLRRSQIPGTVKNGTVMRPLGKQYVMRLGDCDSCVDSTGAARAWSRTISRISQHAFNEVILEEPTPASKRRFVQNNEGAIVEHIADGHAADAAAAHMFAVARKGTCVARQSSIQRVAPPRQRPVQPQSPGPARSSYSSAHPCYDNAQSIRPNAPHPGQRRRSAQPLGSRRVQVMSRNVLLSRLGERCNSGVDNAGAAPLELRGSLGSTSQNDALPLVMHGSVGRHITKVAEVGISAMSGRS